MRLLRLTLWPLVIYRRIRLERRINRAVQHAQRNLERMTWE